MPIFTSRKKAELVVMHLAQVPRVSPEAPCQIVTLVLFNICTADEPTNASFGLRSLLCAVASGMKNN